MTTGPQGRIYDEFAKLMKCIGPANAPAACIGPANTPAAH